VQLHLAMISSMWIFPANLAGQQIGLSWRWWETTAREVSKDQGVLGVPPDQPPHGLAVQVLVHMLN